MRLRFVVQKSVADPRHDGPLLVPKRTPLPALRTGVLRSELHRLLLRGRLEGPREQGLDRRHGDVFHLSEVDVESRSVLAPVLPNDDFPPPPRQFLDSAKVLCGRLTCCHVASLQAFGYLARTKFYPRRVRLPPTAAK
jgi:hypothetical protein